MTRTKEAFTYPRHVRFHCTRCALCCGDTENRTRRILLLTDEARTISRSLSKPVDTFATKLEGREPYAYEMRKKGNEGKCVHLEASHCGIYELRPLVCRFYPFELLTIQDGEHVFLCTNECPGIGRGKQLDKNHFKTLFQLATDQLKTKKERNCRARVFLNSRAAQRGSSQGKTETNMASRDPI